jgi:hypothetical protein
VKALVVRVVEAPRNHTSRPMLFDVGSTFPRAVGVRRGRAVDRVCVRLIRRLRPRSAMRSPPTHGHLVTERAGSRSALAVIYRTSGSRLRQGRESVLGHRHRWRRALRSICVRSASPSHDAEASFRRAVGDVEPTFWPHLLAPPAGTLRALRIQRGVTVASRSQLGRPA